MTTKKEIKEKIESLDRKVGAALGKITNVIEESGQIKAAYLSLVTVLKDLLNAIEKAKNLKQVNLGLEEYNLFTQSEEETPAPESAEKAPEPEPKKATENDEWINGREASILLGWESRYISANNLVKMGVAFRQQKKNGVISINRRSLEKYIKQHRK